MRKRTILTLFFIGLGIVTWFILSRPTSAPAPAGDDNMLAPVRES